MKRRTRSAPLGRFLDLYTPEGWILDFGCGHGADVAFLQSLGYNAFGTDKHILSHDYNWHIPFKFLRHYKESFSCILCTYVLNVIKTRNQRLEAIKLMDYLLKPDGIIFVTTRTQKEINKLAARSSWAYHNDGFITGRGTFQKGFTGNDLCSHMKISRNLHGIRMLNEGKFTTVLARKGSNQ